MVIVILQIVNLTKKQNNNEINEKLSRTEINVIKEISDFKHDFSSYLNKDFNTLNDRIERKLNMIKIKVIEIEKNNIIKKDPNDTIAESIRKYIEKVVDGKC